MKLPNLFGKENELTDEQIHNIIFSEIKDEEIATQYALVFGSPDYQENRVNKAVELYNTQKVKKLIFIVGTGRETISNI